ncbi:NIPSNAP family protein [Actinacidiphila acidipaludis]|uniref:NIPSNAP family protein n=1 Tax=Actinacidiphila acidipaludis TaxID=2873382 RepID=A0ABS7PZB5_9ACTN|nr:NIPSNAP family protein [Streptomyces acidipaludis]MBY8876218.1 NIPSNAP family protein [Streptomyces acidipaludis]
MIFELREYIALPGRAEELHRRFAEDTLDLFDDVGLDLRGFWHEVGERWRIVYLCAFADTAEAAAFWETFRADPRWIALKERTEATGPLIEEIVSTYLTEPDYVLSRR